MWLNIDVAGVGWNARLVKDDIPGAVADLKAEADKDLVLLGGRPSPGPSLPSTWSTGCASSSRRPCSGGGERLFAGDYARRSLALESATPIDTGAVILAYRRAR